MFRAPRTPRSRRGGAVPTKSSSSSSSSSAADTCTGLPALRHLAALALMATTLYALTLTWTLLRGGGAGAGVGGVGEDPGPGPVRGDPPPPPAAALPAAALPAAALPAAALPAAAVPAAAPGSPLHLRGGGSTVQGSPSPSPTPTPSPSPTPPLPSPTPLPAVLLTFANAPKPQLCDYLLTSASLGWKVTIFGWEGPLERNAVPQLQTGEYYMGKRLLAIHAYATKRAEEEAAAATAAATADHPNTAPPRLLPTVFVFSDAYDVLLQRSPQDAAALFHAFADTPWRTVPASPPQNLPGVPPPPAHATFHLAPRVVVATEPDCWPPEFEARYPAPAQGTLYRFVNGGGYAGTAAGLAAFTGALMKEGREFAPHELVYDRDGVITGDGGGVDRRGFLVSLPECVDVDVEATWDVRVDPVCMEALDAAAAGVDDDDERRRVRERVGRRRRKRAGGSAWAAHGTRKGEAEGEEDAKDGAPSSAIADRTQVRVPGFLRRNDQLMMGLLASVSATAEREDRIGLALDTGARLFQSLQVPQESLPDHVRPCTKRKVLGEGGAAAAPPAPKNPPFPNADVSLRPAEGVPVSTAACPFDGALANANTLAVPVAVHWNGPAKYAVEGSDFSMKAAARRARVFAVASVGGPDAALLAIQRSVTVLHGASGLETKEGKDELVAACAIHLGTVPPGGGGGEGGEDPAP
jgi:hypothetical protein